MSHDDSTTYIQNVCGTLYIYLYLMIEKFQNI
jgi:hypothetical protein